jgi:hypothetical protein
MSSPFKFLDPYGKNDADIFFGRDKETAQLFNAVHASNLTLLYGASGTGKTSLINCGLANKFYDTDWLPLFIRRKDNLNAAFDEALDIALSKKKDSTPADWKHLPLAGKINWLFLDNFKPIYLMFDQFEELFILGTKEEQSLFYKNLKNILDTEGLPVKVIIIIREEWIAYLNEFEKVIPYLFDNRLRVEQMSYDTLCEVVEGTLLHAGVQVIDWKNVIDGILDNIRDKKSGIELTNLQVYLDRVYREAWKNSPNGKVNFTPSVISDVGKMENVISAFLDEELQKIELKMLNKGITNTKGLPLEILFTLVSDDGTKQALDIAEIISNLPTNRNIKPDDVAFCLNEFKNMRILKDVE